MSADYAAFLDAKTQLDGATGFAPDDLPSFLFPFQRFLTEWAIRQGRAAIFADCGLGKTPMQLVWADNIRRRTWKPVLIVTPLAVGFQTVGEAHKFGMEAVISRDGKPAGPITVTNYERLHLFDRTDFGGMVCDESSAIKSFDGVHRALVTDFMRKMEYRLLCTATAAPNDFTELGTSSEALGFLDVEDMLGRFFVNDMDNKVQGMQQWRGQGRYTQWQGHRDVTTSGDGKRETVRSLFSPGWRFKGHAEDPFWRWVASWARATRKPSDLGFDDDGFLLPPLEHRLHIVQARTKPEGTLFELPAIGLSEERDELRRSLTERCETVAALVDHDQPAVVWCHLNAEGNLLAKMIPGAVQVAGSDSAEDKEARLLAFSRGEARVLITKPKIGAWGLNWQHCAHMTMFPSHSYEQYYQAVRRSWRFGQKRPVVVDLVTTEGGRAALENLERKEAQASRMFDRLVRHMGDAISHQRRVHHGEKLMEVPAWL